MMRWIEDRALDRAVRLAWLAGVIVLLGAGAVDAKSGLTVVTSAATAGQVVRGTVTIQNTTGKPAMVSAVRLTLEVRYPSGTIPPALPIGSSSDAYVVTSQLLPAPGALAAGATARVPYEVTICAPGVASYRGAKDMRAVAAVAAGAQSASGRSASFTPPLQSACPVCGNGVLESGEQCDGTPCCTSLCRWTADGTSCNDGNACTRSDACLAGTCSGGAPVLCAAQDQCHAAGVCDPRTGTCSNPIAPNGAACDDGSACSLGDACLNGRCAGAPLPCDDGNACTDDTCAGGECVHADNSAPCDDGSLCSDGDTCIAGECLAGAPLDCDDHQTCTVDACDEVDACTHQAEPVCVGCDADECVVCQDACGAADEACATGCWEGFWSCVSGCTSTYCAPFCQVDLGRCLDACPDRTACDAACESGNGCGLGCVPLP